MKLRNMKKIKLHKDIKIIEKKGNKMDASWGQGDGWLCLNPYEYIDEDGSMTPDNLKRGDIVTDSEGKEWEVEKFGGGGYFGKESFSWEWVKFKPLRKEIDKPCSVCGEEVAWGKDGCPVIPGYESKKHGFGILMNQFPPGSYWRHYECGEENKLTNSGEPNKPEHKIMQELTPKVIQTFLPDERILFRAGLLNEEKNWTELARGFAIDMFLNSQKKEIVRLAKELVDEERENMLGGFLTNKMNKQ